MVNVAGLVIQLFLVSRVVKYLGIRVAIMILPLISLGAYGLLAFFPMLGDRALGQDRRERDRLLA